MGTITTVPSAKQGPSDCCDLAARCRHGPLLLLLPPCSPPGLLLVNKPQPCEPLQSSVLHLHESCITQPQGLDNSPSVQGRPCHTCSRARELRGRASPCEHGSRRLSRRGAATASFPGTSGGVCAVGMGLEALWTPFPALDIFFAHMMLPAGASDAAGFSCTCHKRWGLWGALSLICGSWGSLVLENSKA